MRFALLGASGATGRQVILQAKERDMEVVAVVRDQNSLDDIKHDKMQVRVGDIFDEASLAAAFEGCDAVMSCLGTRGSYNLLPWAHVTLYSQSAPAIIGAMRKASIDRFVVLTSACTKYKAEHPWLMEWFMRPLFLGRILADLARMEDYLFSQECEDINYTVVRPNHLTNGPATDPSEMLAEEGMCVLTGGHQLSRADLARFMVDCFQTQQWDRKAAALGHV